MNQEHNVTHLPSVENSWTTGTILASATSIMSLLAMIGSIIWYSAKLDSVVQYVPEMQKTQVANTEDILILQQQQRFTDSRYIEIQTQLAKINDKLDRRDK